MASLENVTGSLFLDEWGKIIMKKTLMRARKRGTDRYRDGERE